MTDFEASLIAAVFIVLALAGYAFTLNWYERRRRCERSEDEHEFEGHKYEIKRGGVPDAIDRLLNVPGAKEAFQKQHEDSYKARHPEYHPEDEHEFEDDYIDKRIKK